MAKLRISATDRKYAAFTRALVNKEGPPAEMRDASRAAAAEAQRAARTDRVRDIFAAFALFSASTANGLISRIYSARLNHPELHEHADTAFKRNWFAVSAALFAVAGGLKLWDSAQASERLDSIDHQLAIAFPEQPAEPASTPKA